MDRIERATAETVRLAEDAERKKNWKRWGPYLAERQWGTVREDYSPNGDCWEYFTHEQARSRAYRWGEDGLLGITDRECRLCFALALWNGRDPILKERLYGLTNSEGNHGEDVKEYYFYLDSTPTHSYLKGLYKYPQAEFPYARLVEENRRRNRAEPEFELADTGIFADNRYFDVTVEYAKASPDDILIRISVENRGPDAAPLQLLPTLWFRNTWTWQCTHEGCSMKPRISPAGKDTLVAEHETLGRFRLAVQPGPDGRLPKFLFTENETNVVKLFKTQKPGLYFKDAFHEYVVRQDRDAVNRRKVGTKAAAYYRLVVPAQGQVTIRLRLTAMDEFGVPPLGGKVSDKPADSDSSHARPPEGGTPNQPRSQGTSFGAEFDRVFTERIREAEEFFVERLPEKLSGEESRVVRQAYAGLLWSKQFYHYVVKEWLAGDPGQPAPPARRKLGRNLDWQHSFNRDVLSMPDKWEYPWYAAWDLAFHLVALARIDPSFAKDQLVLFLREWYMHPNGQIPAYEFGFSDVNPPVHAWAAWRVYKITGAKGKRDRDFLARVFQKLLLNFTWWVNRKDIRGKNLFSGGFLGLDNIGVFDRSQPLPTAGHLEQADATAWMAFYCTTMLGIALKLAEREPAYEDMASKFFEHFVSIADAMNCLGGTGLWHEQDGFYYDQIQIEGAQVPLRVRSMVGIIPLFAVEILEDEVLAKLPAFCKRMRWFLENRQDLARHISYMECQGKNVQARRLLAIPSRERLERVLRYVLDENEFLSPYGIRSVSRAHKDRPYVFSAQEREYRVDYEPGEATTALFGGNSNWRGPVWFPLNYLLIEALERYHHFYGDTLRVECPTGSGRRLNLLEVAHEINSRLVRLFLPDAAGRRPCQGDDQKFAGDPHWRELLLFHEYFHGETGRGLGASHQTGWTALVTRCVEDMARRRK